MRPKRSRGFEICVDAQIKPHNAEQAVSRLWTIADRINEAFSDDRKMNALEGLQRPDTLIEVPLPSSLAELRPQLPRILRSDIRYSAEPPYKVDLASDYVPGWWNFHMISKDGSQAFSQGTVVDIHLGGDSKMSEALRAFFYGPVGPVELQHAFDRLIEVFDGTLAVASPLFQYRYKLGSGTFTADAAGVYVGWLTYVRDPGIDVDAIDWGTTKVYPLHCGYVFKADSDDPVNDPDLFDKIITVRDQLRAHGDIVRRRYALNRGKDPNNLPPHPPGPEYTLESE